MPAWDRRARRGPDAHVVVDSTPDMYRTWFRKLVLQTACRSQVDQPLLFLNAWSEWAEEVDGGHPWLGATRDALHDGLRQYYASLGYPLGEEQIADYVRDVLPGRAGSGKAASLTGAGFPESELDAIRERYAGFAVPRVGYATVRDYVDSSEHLRPLATAAGDLKDVQRPWMLKAVLGTVPAGGRVLEIGAGEPLVADLLARLGYEVWVVDPYDGSGNGPVEFERYRRGSPGLHFVRDRFSDELAEIEPGAFDCVYSISVLEHIDPEGIDGVVRGIRRALKPSGTTIHAVDHIERGEGGEHSLALLGHVTVGLGVPAEELEAALARLSEDTETYYLSAEAHDRWRGELPYEAFPMRACVSVDLAVSASATAPSTPARGPSPGSTT
jgi:2-polyprenyl-3-methyl-5-hydroxy-6-metoxy-1,4-benzoquinol methylase